MVRSSTQLFAFHGVELAGHTINSLKFNFLSFPDDLANIAPSGNALAFPANAQPIPGSFLSEDLSPDSRVIDCSRLCQMKFFSYLQGQCRIWGYLATWSRVFPATQRWPVIPVNLQVVSPPAARASAFLQCFSKEITVNLASPHQPVQKSPSQKAILNVTLKWWLRLHVLGIGWNINPWIRVHERNSDERRKLNLLRCLPVGSWVRGRMLEVFPALNPTKTYIWWGNQKGIASGGFHPPCQQGQAVSLWGNMMGHVLFGKSKLSKPFR